MRRAIPHTISTRYILIAILSFTIGSATIVQAAPGMPLFRLADGTDGSRVATIDADGDLQVKVKNAAATQSVSGTVNVGNLPTTQAVSGSVSVSNLPTTQAVSGSVSVSNLPATQPVSGTVNVANLPTTQQVTGTVAVSNLPGQVVATRANYRTAEATPGSTGEWAFGTPINLAYLNIHTYVFGGGCWATIHLSNGGTAVFDPHGGDLSVPFPIRVSVSKISWHNFNVVGDCSMGLTVIYD